MINKRSRVTLTNPFFNAMLLKIKKRRICIDSIALCLKINCLEANQSHHSVTIDSNCYII